MLGAWAVVWAAHYPLLHLPYYWDEAGYYIPAAYDFFRTGTLIPFSTLSNAHPPLPSILLATSWKLFGFQPFVTRTTVCLVSALALVAVWRLALAVGCRPSVAIASALLTGVYPVFFAQSSLAHADIFAASLTLWALVYFAENRRWAAVICFALAALAKETAIATPLALALWELWMFFRLRHAPSRRQHFLTGATLLIPALPLIGWYAYHHAMTGFTFGNPQFLRYNATATLEPQRIAIALFHRTLQVTMHMNLFVPFLLMLACLFLPPLKGGDGLGRPRIAWGDQAIFYVVIVANVIFFSLFGGALLTRYLLPVYPLVLILCVNTFWRRLRNWEYAVALSAIGFAIGLFVNPPYQFAPEDNLEYASFVHLQQDATRQIELHYARSNVLTAWPASDELRKPSLGYVRQPVAVTPIEDFAPAQIADAAREPGKYDVALVFSTKYDPPHLALRLGPWNTRIDKRYFDYHRDLSPAAIARILGGKIEWQEHRKGLWAAVITFNHPEWADIGIPNAHSGLQTRGSL